MDETLNGSADPFNDPNRMYDLENPCLPGADEEMDGDSAEMILMGDRVQSSFAIGTVRTIDYTTARGWSMDVRLDDDDVITVHDWRAWVTVVESIDG